MKKYLEYELEGENSIIVEIDDFNNDGEIEEVCRDENKVISKSIMRFEDALDKVKPAATIIIDKLKNLSSPPDQIQVEFGLKMNAEAGAVIASTGVEANYKINLTWNKGSK